MNREASTGLARWLPAPLESAAIAATWLVLNGTLALGHVLLALALALAIPLATRRLHASRPKLGAPVVAVRLLLVVVWDIVLSNIQVARLILGPRAAITSRFIRYRVDLADPHAVALLAAIITMTPGTLSADISADRREILIHSLHAPDPQAIVDAIRRRYEAPLREIFRC